MHKLANNYSAIETFFEQLQNEIECAKTVVYELDKKTPLNRFRYGNCSVWTKREDCSTIRSYKWRGAYFKMHQLVQDGFDGEIVAASAGNHAQGVAIAARRLQLKAKVFMPRTTPQLKQNAVREFGGEYVSIELTGDSFDESAQAASRYQKSNSATMLKPFDDLSVIAGQATVGLEMLQQCPDLTKIYVPIGGGGLASGVAFALKRILNSDCKIIGVEAENQNSMQLALRCGQRVVMDQTDNFCDGTAVKQSGQYTFEICRKYLDDIITISNGDVSSAIRSAWEAARFIPEPSGAIALAAAIVNAKKDKNESVGAVVSGSNMDFRMLPRIVRKSTPTQNRIRYFRFQIPETNGSLIQLLDQFMNELNIVDFQYGKTDHQIAQPVLGIEGPGDQLDQLESATEAIQVKTMEISGESLSEFRVIPFQPDLCISPLFLKVDFPNRPGALRELMRRISTSTNICYFNFTDSGELEGHALIGFELIQSDSEYKIRESLFELGLKFQSTNG